MLNLLLNGPKNSPITTNNDSYVVGSFKQKTKKDPAPKGDPFAADSLRVFVLGEAPTAKKQIDVYSGVNGFRLRTIPQERFGNPALIGAGGNLLAVACHYAGYDVIRVTDSLAGGAMDDYDEYGQPISSVDFSTIPDHTSIQTPAGTSVSCLKILSTGVLLAGIAGTGSLSVLKADLSGANVSYYNGFVPFDPDFAASVGECSGGFCYFSDGSGLYGHLALGCAWSGTLGGSVFVFDYVTGTLAGFLGLGLDLKPIAVHQNKKIVTVLLADPATGDAKRLLRFTAQDESYLFSGVTSDKITPAPQTFPVTQGFQPQDLPGVTVTSPQELLRYRQIAKDFNAAPAPSVVYATDGIDLPTAQKPFISVLSTPTDSITISDGKTQYAGTITTYRDPNKPFTIPVGLIDIPDGTGFVTIDGTTGSIAEIYQKLNADGSVDPTKPLFHLVHASHYDYLGLGGYSAECLSGSSASVPNTNRLRALDVATDLSGELGIVSPLPDLKAAVVDSATGLLLYNYPKPLGRNFFGGLYPTFTPYATTDVVQTPCGVEAEGVATALDGLVRPTLLESSTYETEYAGPLDYDFPWSYFLRRVNANDPVKLKLTETHGRSVSLPSMG